MAETDKDVGKICWLDVPVYDVERAKKFYTEVLGWECNLASFANPAPGAHSMHFFKNASGVNGAFSHMKDGLLVTNFDKGNAEALPILPTFNVANCQETLDKASKAGGQLQYPRTYIGNDMGFYGRFIDSEGNMVGIWSSK